MTAAAERPPGLERPACGSAGAEGVPLLELRDVFCVHRTAEGDAAALRGASLTVLEGELVCVLGPSGAGKSTLLRVIAGLQRPSAGSVSLQGVDIGRARSAEQADLRHRLIGFVHQHSGATLPPDPPLRQAVALPLALRGIPRREGLRRAGELLSAAGLSDRAGSRSAELSGGERQRAALCLALAHRPRLLLADEPTGELDAASAARMLALIAELARGSGTATILVSHDAAASELADRLVLLRDGQPVEASDRGSGPLRVQSGGWVQLPGPLLEAAGIVERVRASFADEGGVLLTGVDASPAHTLLAARPAPEHAAALSLQSVSRALGRGAGARRVLDDLTHTFASGRLTAVTGPSGSGKTTLLRLLAGLDAPDDGTVWLNGRPLSTLDAERRARLRRTLIGYLPQEPFPVAFLRAEENVALALALRGWSSADARNRARVVLAQLGLAERSRQLVARLSAGESQRVALARALAGARGLLVVDEPTSRLDRERAGQVARLLGAVAVQEGQTVVCATHDPELIRQAHDRLELG